MTDAHRGSPARDLALVALRDAELEAGQLPKVLVQVNVRLREMGEEPISMDEVLAVGSVAETYRALLIEAASAEELAAARQLAARAPKGVRDPDVLITLYTAALSCVLDELDRVSGLVLLAGRDGRLPDGRRPD